MFQGLTLSELGNSVGVSHAFLCQVEAGAKVPSDLLLSALADRLGFETSFFFTPLADEFRDEECFFRRRRTTPLYVRQRVLAHGTLFSHAVGFLESILDLPKCTLPEIRVGKGEDIERCAEECRLRWKLGIDTPIANMTRVLENAGVVVARFDASADKIDAFSRMGTRCITVVNSDKQSTSRNRFDLAHECGHLVMHRGLDSSCVEYESQADAFASAFLLPRSAFVAEFPCRSRLHWPVLLQFKRRWKVSLAAIVRRAADLALIDAAEYKRAYKYLHAAGWHRGEPDEPAPEFPETVAKGFTLLMTHRGDTPSSLAKQLGWKKEIFERVVRIEPAPIFQDETENTGVPHRPNLRERSTVH